MDSVPGDKKSAKMRGYVWCVGLGAASLISTNPEGPRSGDKTPMKILCHPETM